MFMKNDNFVHLHTHTEYSFKDAVNNISSIIKKVYELNMNSIAITDHGNMHAAMPFYNECCKHSLSLLKEQLKKECDDSEIEKITSLVPNMSIRNALKEVEELKIYQEKYKKAFDFVLEKEIKPILGIETYVLPCEEMLKCEKLKHSKYHLVLLAKDIIGYQQLCKISTKSQMLKDKNTYPRMTYKDMADIFKGNHIIALSACIAGEIPNYLLQGYEIQKEIDILKQSLLKDKELLLKCKNDNSSIVPNISSEEYIEFKQEEINKKEDDIKLKEEDLKIKEKYLFAGAKYIAKKYIDIFGKENFFIEVQKHGLKEEEYVYPKLIQLAKELNIKMVATNDCHYTEKKEAHKRDILVALRFDRTLTDPTFKRDMGELYIKSGNEMKNLFFDNPEAFNNTRHIADMCNIVFKKEKHFPVFQCPIGFTENEYLEKMTYEGLYRKYNFDKLSDFEKNELKGRIKYELQVIEKLKYSGYLLIVSDFIKHGRKIGQIGPGRGSAVGSVVCYCLDITNVEPIRYNLFFERFLNVDRVSDPDIDTDFDDTRDAVIAYVEEKYGKEAVCQIATFGTMAAKGAIRNVGRAIGKPLTLCDKISKLIPTEVGMTIEKALNTNLELKNLYETDNEVKELISDALLLEGTIIQTGVHAAGVIIADKAVDNYVPLMYNDKKGVWVTQYDKDICEGSCGLLKMDFLGLENLTIIKRTLRDIEKNYNKKISIDDIPYDDPDVIREIFAKGNTKGVFQFESGGMMNLLTRFGPKNIEDLILLNAAYRPGPLQYLDEIIDVKHKRKTPTYILPQMEEILGVTYSKPIYQEQIMQIFNKIAGFSLGVADIIRRAMAKKKLKVLKEYLPKFKSALIKKGATEKDSEKFCEELMDFASYAFNKSHAAAYAIVAYITGYLKFYYPVEYMSNILNSAKQETLSFYLKECNDLNIPVLPPNINESGKLFTPTKEKTILFGLTGIKNVAKAATSIIEIRQKYNGFTSFKDFINKLRKEESSALNKKVIESLIYSGAFDNFKQSRNDLIGGLEEYTIDIKTITEKIKENDILKISIQKDFDNCNNIITSFKNKQQNCLKETLLNPKNVDFLNEYLKLIKDYFKKVQKPKTRQTTIDRAIQKIKETSFEEKYLNYSLIDNKDSYNLEILDNLLENLTSLKRELSLSKSRIITIESINEKLNNYNYFVAKENLSKNQLLYKEKDLIGYYATGNPLQTYSKLIRERSSLFIGDLLMDITDINSNIQQKDGLNVELVCEIEDLNILNRKSDGAEMCAFKIGDLTGNIDCIIFVNQFAKYKHLIQKNNICIIKGFLQIEIDIEDAKNNKIQINVQKVEEINCKEEKAYIKIKNLSEWKKIKNIIQESVGFSSLYIYVEDKEQLYKVKQDIDIDILQEKICNTLGQDCFAIA